jgi:hypothetical protein
METLHIMQQWRKLYTRLWKIKRAGVLPHSKDKLQMVKDLNVPSETNFYKENMGELQ